MTRTAMIHLAAALLACSTVSVAQQAPACGDCNGDGRINILDALLASQHAASGRVLISPEWEACNVQGTPGGPGTPGATVDVLDALTIAQFAVGIGGPLSCAIRSAVGLVALGPGSSLGMGPNLVGGGPTPGDPCSYDQDFTFSLGGANLGELTEEIHFRLGGNPLVFDREGQNAQLILELSTTGPGAPLTDVSAAVTADGTTTYQLTPGVGGPYTSVAADGLVTSLLVGTSGMSGCDRITATFTPNGMGDAGGASGAPLVTTFAACLDYYGWDRHSRDDLGMLAPGDWDAHMPGTPSGSPPPAAGDVVQILYVGAANPGDAPATFEFRLHYDNTILEARLFSHTETCQTPATGAPYTCTSSPAQPWRVNCFRVGASTFGAAGIQHEMLCELTLCHVSSGPIILRTTQNEWADGTATRISGTFPLPVDAPGCTSGFEVP